MPDSGSALRTPLIYITDRTNDLFLRYAGEPKVRVCVLCGARFDNGTWGCPSCGNSPQVIAGHPALSPELAETGEGFKARYFEELAGLEARNFWFRARNNLIIYALRRYFPEAKSFLEIGCGTGFVLSALERALPDLSLFGSDVHSSGLSFASKRVRKAELFQMDARSIPFEGEFDLIGAFDVLEHIKEDIPVLSEIHRALKRGGGIILTVPQHAFLWSKYDEYACHVRRYGMRDLRSKVESAGFNIVRVTSFVSILLPFMIVSRQLRNRVREYDVMAELKINKGVNTVLEKFLDLEKSAIGLGVNFPFGGSLLLIARKA